MNDLDIFRSLIGATKRPAVPYGEKMVNIRTRRQAKLRNRARRRKELARKTRKSQRLMK